MHRDGRDRRAGPNCPEIDGWNRTPRTEIDEWDRAAWRSMLDE